MKQCLDFVLEVRLARKLSPIHLSCDYMISEIIWETFGVTCCNLMCLICYYDLSDPKRLKVVCKDNIKFQKMIMLISTDCEFSTLAKSNMDFVHVAMGPAKQTHFPVFLPSRVGHMIKFWLMKISRNGMCLLYLCFFFIFGVRRRISVLEKNSHLECTQLWKGNPPYSWRKDSWLYEQNKTLLVWSSI